MGEHLLSIVVSIIPYDNTVTPYDNTVMPYDNTVTPYDNTVIPYDNTVILYDNNVILFDNTVIPYDNTVILYTGKDVKYQRSVSSEALRDMKVTLRPKRDLTLPPISKSSTTPSISTAIHPWHSMTAHSAHGSHNTVVHAEVHTDLSPDSAATPTTSTLTDSGVVNDPFAYDADHILSKHQSLIVGSMEDVFSVAASSVRDCVISEEELVASNSVSAPAPPPRPRSACPSESGETVGEAGDAGPPPLPPKQYKGSRRKYKPLPAEPPEPDGDSSDRNTDSESIQQEIKTLTSQIEFMSSATLH